MASGADQTTNAVNHRRVLVVDDDAESRESVGQALERAGFAPTRAATGEQGVVRLREWPRRIGWLYTKAELPGLVDGWILADEFHQAHPSRPVLYGVPRYARHQYLQRGIALTTPVSPRGVAEVLLRLSRRCTCHRGDALGSLRHARVS